MFYGKAARFTNSLNNVLMKGHIIFDRHVAPSLLSISRNAEVWPTVLFSQAEGSVEAYCPLA